MRIAFLGAGELTAEFCTTLAERSGDVSIVVYSRSRSDPERGRRARQLSERRLAVVVDDLRSAVEGADVVLSAVSGSQLLKVAEAVAGLGHTSGWFIDLNSGDPQDIVASARLLEAAGWRYVDAGVMGPAPHGGHRTPMVISGREASEAATLLDQLGFSVRYVGDRPGQASSLKLLRNLVGKNIGAVVIEVLAAGAALGAADMALEFVYEILDSDKARRRVDRWVEGTIEHAERRLKEQASSALMVEEAGTTAFLARGTMQLLQRLIEIEAPSMYTGGARPALRSVVDELARRMRGRQDDSEDRLQ